MGNNGFGENFEGRHKFANSKLEVRTPLSKLIWGTMNIKAHMHICMHMHVHVHVLVCEKIHPWIHKMQFGFRRRRSIADDIAIVRRIAQIARKKHIKYVYPFADMCAHIHALHVYHFSISFYSLIVPMPQKLARAAKGWPTRRMTSRCRCTGAHAHMYAHACTCTFASTCLSF